MKINITRIFYCLFVCLLASNFCLAQEQMYIYKSNAILLDIPVKNVDSITFEKKIPPDTLYVNTSTSGVLSFAISNIDSIIFYSRGATNPVTDVDGNVYSTVAIGQQLWLKENLKVTRYNNGELIGTTATINQDISLETEPKYQWPVKGDEANVNDYGRLYTWYTINDCRNVCPVGWHVATDADWLGTTDSLGGATSAYNKLLETGNAHWICCNGSATNSSGLTILPSGGRSETGYPGFGQYTDIWTSTSASPMVSWYRYLGVGFNLYRSTTSKYYGFAVRCVHDAKMPTPSSVGECKEWYAEDTIQLAGNTPWQGTGSWSIAQGTGGWFEDVTKPTSKFSGTAGQLYKLVWTISYLYNSLSDTLTVNYYDPLAPANRIVDVDSNIYNIIKIGSQTWMKENLKVSRLNDGTPIPFVSDSATWVNDTIPIYTWYNNDSATFHADYGKLYNWYTVNTNKLCPVGWHVPDSSEWMKLSTICVVVNYTGGKMKERGLKHWLSPNTAATNEFGFTALPGGSRAYGKFVNLGIRAVFWSTSFTKTSTSPWLTTPTLTNTGAPLYSGLNEKFSGVPVRCLKD